jgi:hypothetical protein
VCALAESLRQRFRGTLPIRPQNGSVAEEVLYAEARLGELLDLSLRDDKSRHSPEKKLPEGVSLNMSSQCQRTEPNPPRIS